MMMRSDVFATATQLSRLLLMQGAGRTSNDLSPTTTTLARAFNDTRQIEKLHLDTLILKYTRDRLDQMSVVRR